VKHGNLCNILNMMSVSRNVNTKSHFDISMAGRCIWMLQSCVIGWCFAFIVLLLLVFCSSVNCSASAALVNWTIHWVLWLWSFYFVMVLSQPTYTVRKYITYKTSTRLPFWRWINFLHRTWAWSWNAMFFFGVSIWCLVVLQTLSVLCSIK